MNRKLVVTLAVGFALAGLTGGVYACEASNVEATAQAQVVAEGDDAFPKGSSPELIAEGDDAFPKGSSPELIAA